MELKNLPERLQKVIDGINYFMLSETMSWLKGSKKPELATVYKRRCNQSHIVKYKEKNQKGKPRIYVTIEGLKEIVDKTQNVKLDYKRMLGLNSGLTRSEHVFRSLLDGFFGFHGVDVEYQVYHDGYFIDFVIGGVVAVEFDEGNHSSYCTEKEMVREAVIKSKYNLIRVTDRENEGLAIAKVFSVFIRKQEQNQ